MNLILLFESDFIDVDRVNLRGRRFEHVRDVLRPETGDELIVGVNGGQIGRGRVLRLAPSELEMRIVLDREPPAAASLTLILSLPRPKVLSRVIASATAMGIKRIYLINSWRVEKSFWTSPRLAEEHLREDMVIGLEQGRDTILPSVTVRKRFRPFVEDELPHIAAGTIALVAHPVAESECPSMVHGEVTLAVGPEGGFIDNEIAMFERCGFEAVRFGERILRVESAVPALIGRLGK